MPHLFVTVVDGHGRPTNAGLGAWLERAAPANASGSVTAALVSDAVMRRLNRTYRRTDYATDVLSFPRERHQVSGLRPGRRTSLRSEAGNSKLGHSPKALRPQAR